MPQSPASPPSTRGKKKRSPDAPLRHPVRCSFFGFQITNKGIQCWQGFQGFSFRRVRFLKSNIEQAGIEAGFLGENIARASYSSRHSGRTALKSCSFRVRFFRSEITNISPRPYSGRPQDVRGTPAGVLLPCHGHRPAEGGSPTNRTREHAGGMSEGKAPNQSADWRERRSKGLGAQAERWPDAVRTAPSAMPTAAELRQCPLSCFPFFGPVRSVSGGRGKKRLIYEAKTSSTRV